jgi:hypothetical protein
MSFLRAVCEKMVLDQFLWCLTEPLEEREVLELVGAKDLKDLNILIVAQVLNEVAHVPGNNANITGLVVESTGSALGCEDRDAGTTLDEVRPLVGIGYDVLATGIAL